MKVVKEFLQSSTIHGLTYIATTDKLARLFWMSVVLSGFTLAAVLIQRSDLCTALSIIQYPFHFPRSPAYKSVSICAHARFKTLFKGSIML